MRNAVPLLDERTIVLNGDVLTDVDLGAIVARHEEQGASATIVLTPVPNPAAYGLVETDPEGRVLRFIEKPEPGADHHRHHQRRHLRARDGRPRADARRREPLDRARLLPRPARARRPGRRARPPRLLDRHRHPREVPAGPPRHPERPLSRRPRRRAAGRGVGAPDRPRVPGSPPRRALLRRARGARSRPERGSGPDAVLVADVRVQAGALRARQRPLARGRGRGRTARSREASSGRAIRLGRSSVLRDVVLGEGTVVSDYSRTL